MDLNTDLDIFLTAYLLKELDAAQEAVVLNWLGSDERNKQYFEELKNTTRLIAVKQTFDNINVGQEWKHFKKEIARRKEERSGFVRDQIPVIETYTEEPKRRAGIFKFFVSTAVAASVLLIVGLGWREFFFKQNIQEVKIVSIIEQPALPGNMLKHEVNTSGRPKTLHLKDGSFVTLADKSELTFPEPFAGDKRDINLIGKASFKVAKDKTKPFTVFSGDISTTALGTEFTVTAFKNAGTITVRLYEGKVVVKSADEVKKKLKQNYYLNAGQELVYDIRKVTAQIKKFATGKPTVIVKNEKDDKPIDNPSIPLFDKGSWYMFNNQSLNHVFDQLEEMYNVEISYNKKDVQKLYFIGKFNKSDSVEAIIRQIALLNSLKVQKQDSIYILSK